MPISMGYPVLASALAALLLGEHLSVTSGVGVLVTLLGAYVVAMPSGEAARALSPRPAGYWRGWRSRTGSEAGRSRPSRRWVPAA
jgi:drug/metabolite transporter (DMT)-like permease